MDIYVALCIGMSGYIRQYLYTYILKYLFIGVGDDKDAEGGQCEVDQLAKVESITACVLVAPFQLFRASSQKIQNVVDLNSRKLR